MDDFTQRKGGSVSKRRAGELVQDILGFRRFGPPPFLVRNLSYVKEHKDQDPNNVADLRWSTRSVRGDGGRRQLFLKCFAKRCILTDATIKRIKRKVAGHRHLPKAQNGGALFQPGKLRLWVSVVLRSEECISFGVRETSIRLWPKTFADSGGTITDLNIAQSFDLSAMMSFLMHFPNRLSIVAEIYALDASGCVGMEQSPMLRGEHVLLDSSVSASTSLPDQEVVLELRNPREQGLLKFPAMGIKPGDDNVAAMSDTASHNVLFNGAAQSGPIARPNGNGMARTNGGRPKADPCGHVSIGLTGSLNNAKEEPEALDPFKEHVLVKCTYRSDSIRNWEGLIRHDFMCPWCHRNCRRLRTLLSHFHLEHEQMEISLDAMQESGENQNEPFFTINFRIDPAPAYRQLERTRADPNAAGEHVMVNRSRHPLYPIDNGADVTDQLDMRKCAVRDEGDSDATVADDEVDVSLEGIALDQWKRCKHCERPHRCIYEANVHFCGEWCEIAHRNGFVEENGAKKLADLSSSKREPRINFAETLGKRTLYHVVSLNPVKEEEFDEDEPDSEDEVDHSWRLRITEDKLNHLEGTSDKERVLWILWNRYAHDNYPAPGAYAERYTRYSLELFALEYGDEIRRCHLRVPLVGFLRALHVHGLIDADGFQSVILCLDRKKKFDDCRRSRRAEARVPYPATRNGSKKNGSGSAKPARKKGKRG